MAALDEIVICVHGTFAGDKAGKETGHRWWQRESDTWRDLTAALPEGLALPPEDDTVRLFRWSGENSQAERLKAGNRLLAMMLDLERQGRGYHLVGHSHGGSVIWEALLTAHLVRQDREVPRALRPHLREFGLLPKASTSKRSRSAAARPSADFRRLSDTFDLAGLRSWITVGTPFLHYLPKKLLLKRGWPHSRFSLFAQPRQSTALNVLLTFVSLALLLAGFIIVLLTTAHEKDVRTGQVSSVRTVPMQDVPAVLTLACATVLLGMVVLAWVSRRDTSHALAARAYGARAAAQRFGARWLGLWAPTDEAVLGLSRLVDPGEFDYAWLCADPKARSSRSRRPVEPDRILPIPVRLKLRPYAAELVPDALPFRWTALRAPAYIFFNRAVAKRVRKAVAEILLRAAHGTDVPGSTLAYVGSWPLPLTDLPDGLPATIADQLEARAVEHIGQLSGEMRILLARAALDGSGWEAVLATAKDKPDADNALVHTQYFRHPEVLRLICLHLANNSATATAAEVGASAELHQWYSEATASAARRLSNLE